MVVAGLRDTGKLSVPGAGESYMALNGTTTNGALMIRTADQAEVRRQLKEQASRHCDQHFPDSATVCRCNRSLGVICAIFASLAVLALIAQDACLDSGGRVSDGAWVCEVASGASVNIWSLVSPLALFLVALGVGIPVYFGVNALGERFT